MKITDSLFSDMPVLPVLSSEAVQTYSHWTNKLLEVVSNLLGRHPDVVGITPVITAAALRIRHQQHAKIVANMIRINDLGMIMWATLRQYEVNKELGLSGDYFSAELDVWRTAISTCLDHSNYRKELLAFYNWLATCRERVRNSAATWKDFPFPERGNTEELQQLFLALLLMGDYQGGLNFGKRLIQNVDDLKFFNIKVIWPVLYRTGMLWQAGQFSIADGHQTTYLVRRIVQVQQDRFVIRHLVKGRAVVATAANENHEVGAQMVADFLEMEGWDVTYLGANIPGWVLLDTIKQNKPFLLALSVALDTNIMKIQELITVIRCDEEIRDVKIMVGGNAFNCAPLAWKRTGADGFAADAGSATKIINDWWQSRKNSTSKNRNGTIL